MEYHTVYSILDHAAPVPWSHVVIGFFIPLLVAVLEWRKRNWSMLVFIGIWALFWNGGVLPGAWTIYRNHKHAQEYLRSGDCQVAEGTVEQFHPMPYHGHSLESFAVNGVWFSYSDFDLSKPGFNRTESHGGPIHAGMPVRIHYRGAASCRLRF